VWVLSFVRFFERRPVQVLTDGLLNYIAGNGDEIVILA
jgi:hypothetical protein